jgi:hypothetical protein
MQNNKKVHGTTPAQTVATVVKADPKSAGFGKTGSCFKQD